MNKHFAGTQYLGPLKKDFIEMRAEVGVLTRNVKVQGDKDVSEAHEYGV